MKGEIITVDSKTQDRKQLAVQFLQLVVAGRIDEAYQKYVDMQGKHHNPFFPAGFPALKMGMIENQVQLPTKQLTVKNVLGDGDLVAVHSHIVLRPGERGHSASPPVSIPGRQDCGDVGLRPAGASRFAERGWHVLARPAVGIHSKSRFVRQILLSE